VSNIYLHGLLVILLYKFCVKLKFLKKCEIGDI